MYGKESGTCGDQAVRCVWLPHEQETVQREVGGSQCLREAEILRSQVHVLSHAVRESLTRIYSGQNATGRSAEAIMRIVRIDDRIAATPCGREQDEQLTRERADAMRELPCEVALGAREAKRMTRAMRRGNKLALKAYGNTVCPDVVEIIGRAIMEAEHA